MCVCFVYELGARDACSIKIKIKPHNPIGSKIDGDACVEHLRTAMRDPECKGANANKHGVQNSHARKSKGRKYKNKG